MRIRSAKTLGILIITLTVTSLIDTVAYGIYSFDRGVYWVASIDHIIAFHSDGIGLILLTVMALSLLAILLITLLNRD